MKKYVGAIGVRDRKYYCKNCLIQFEILYLYGSEVTATEARKGQFNCMSCKEALHTYKDDSRQVRHN